jgi:hypothetical protein
VQVDPVVLHSLQMAMAKVKVTKKERHLQWFLLAWCRDGHPKKAKPVSLGTVRGVESQRGILRGVESKSESN